MAAVGVLSTSVVQARNNKEQRIQLFPCDLQCFLMRPIQKGLLFFKPNRSDTERSVTTFVEHLKDSLSCTLDIFFPLAGRLALVEHDDDTISGFIDCNNLGAQFVHAVAENVTIADILEPVNVPSSLVHSFFPLNGMINCKGISKPLLGVQATELVDGVFIGCTMNHLAGDGASFWNFFNSWSEISRGLCQISKPPVIDRTFFNGMDLPVSIPCPSKAKTDLEFTPPPLQERFFHFSKAQIAELKAKANAEAGDTENISSLQSLLAHVWRSAIRVGGIPNPDGETSFRLSIGIRPRLQPPLPELYFGNAFVSRCVNLKQEELVEQGHGYAALQMNKMVALHKEDYHLQRGLQNPGMIPTPRLVTNRTFAVSCSPRYNVYGTDFGWGKPVAVRSGATNKYNGKITVYPGEEEGSMDIEVCFSPEILEALGNDKAFMDTLSSNFA